MFISSNLEISRRMSVSQGDKQVHIVDVRENGSDKFHSNSSCLLCGSSDDCSYEMETGNRVKWTLHFCQLFRIDECPLVPKTTKAEMWTTMQSALYCSDCMDSLKRISHLLQTIEDINAQLRIIQLQCEAKLKASKQNLHDPHEVNRRRALWTCMRVLKVNGGGNDVTIDMPSTASTSTYLASKTSDWDNNNNGEDRTGGNSPVSHFLLQDTDSDSTFDSLLKQKPLDNSGSSSMSTLPIDIHQKQKDAVNKVETSDLNDPSSSSTSVFKAIPAPKHVLGKQKPGRIRFTKSDSVSENDKGRKKERIIRRKCQTKSTTVVEIKKRWKKRLHCPFAPKCDRKFHLKSKRDEHVVLVHEGKRFACEICGKSYGQQQLLDEHGNTHKGLTPFKCPDCPKEFAMSLHLRMHKLNAHKFRPLKCKPCGKAFDSDANYQKHLQSASHKRRSTPKVSFEGSTMALFEYEPLMTTTPGGAGLYKCPFPNCTKTYTANGRFMSHLRSHDKPTRARPRPTCTLCQRSYETKRSLERHVALIHTGEAKFRCEHCAFKAVHNSDLERHMKTAHSEERPLKCDICGHTFKHPTYLRSHKQMYHPTTKDHMCSTCGKCFSNKRYLKDHERIHSEVKSFHCSQCGQGFTQKHSLGRHIRRVHTILTAPPASETMAMGAVEAPSESAAKQQVQIYTAQNQYPESPSLSAPSFPQL